MYSGTDLMSLEPLYGSSHLSHKESQMGTEVRNLDISLSFVALHLKVRRGDDITPGQNTLPLIERVSKISLLSGRKRYGDD